MSRLTDKLKQAGGVVARQTAKIEARADAIISLEATIEQQANDAFSPHEAILSQTEKDLADLQHALATVSNGAPLLDTSSGESTTPTPVPNNSLNTHGTIATTTPGGRVMGT